MFENPNHPLALSIADTCRYSSLGRTSVFKAISEGRLRAVKVGRRTLVVYESLLALISNVESQA